MRMFSVASGSSGNCICVGSNNTHILIDAGISKKRIEEGLREKDIDLSDIDAILVTHEHSDHISGLGVVSRKYSIPIYATSETLTQIEQYKPIGEVDKSLFNSIKPDVDFMIEGIKVKPFSVSHDAANPVAYRFNDGDKSVAVATDLGCYTDYTVENLKNLDAILIEANHDIKMLQVGAYPYYLKQRILGKKGHLSNEMSGQLLNSILNDKMKSVFLGHLSQENNYEELAYESVRMEIAMSDNQYKADDFPIQVAKRDRTSAYVEI